MNIPLISVIVPVYNTAPWLEKCLDSICCQTYTHLEIICVNDGSTDDSASILDAYAQRDSRIKVVHQVNRGVSAARNEGLRMATGDYVTGVDSDDYLLPHAYESLIPYLADTPDMLCFGIKGVDAEGHDRSSSYMELPCEGCFAPDENLVEKTNGYFCNKLFRLARLREHKLMFPEGMRYEDAVFVHAASMLANQICYVKERLYCYLQREDSFTLGEASRRQAFDFCLMLETLYEYMAERGMLKSWGNLYRRLFMAYFEYPVHALPGNLQHRALRMYHDMVIRTGMWRDFPGQYPFDELKKYNALRALFFWRKENIKVYKFLKWPVCILERTANGWRRC